MTDEIKEILENIKKQNEWEGIEYFRTPLSNEDADKLLDCMTNLQQENKAKTHQIEVLEEIVNYERNIRNDKLQQENKKLKYNTRGQVNDYFKDKYADEVLKNAKLKEENEFLKLNNPEMNIEHFRIVKENKRKIDNLRKENERLNNKIKEQSLLLIEFQDMEQKVDIYKSRCKKAMELLKLPIIYEAHQENGERDELLKKIRQAKDILNGSDEK